MQTSASGLTYTVYVYENSKPRQSLDEIIAEQSSALDSATERLVIKGKFSGKEYSAKDGKTTEQFFATENRFYRFVVSGATDEPWRVRQFFSSITIGKKPEGLEVFEDPSPADGPGEIVAGKDVDRKARLLVKPEPSYIDLARDNQIEGTVILKAVFSANGYVTNIRVVQGLPYGLTERAIAAARKIKFIPAVKNGKNV
ncbi:MAG TPA: energy transducer TonB, partial [Pyrinomonadaceae bacterium]|nr:energy transducer TonB [Pyrinomonadaceae bacterium]